MPMALCIPYCSLFRTGNHFPDLAEWSFFDDSDALYDLLIRPEYV